MNAEAHAVVANEPIFPQLRDLSHKDLDLITDIVFQEPTDLDEPTDLSTARAYIGEREPCWLAPLGTNSSETAFQSLKWLSGFYDGLTKAIDRTRDRFRFAYGTEGVDRMTFRGKRQRRFDGTVRLSLRRIPQVTPELHELALPPYLRPLLMSPAWLRGGLVLITAPTGQGKSTTLAATIKSRLMRYAGVTMTIEDPVELYLDGFQGAGECVQTEIDYTLPAGDQFAAAIRGSLQNFPAMPGGGASILISEIREPESAKEAIMAAQSGFLVFATLHADTLPHTVHRLINLASDAMPAKDARAAVASTLRLAIFQRLVLAPKVFGWSRGRLSGDVLVSPHGGSPVAIAVRNEEYSALADAVDQQTNRLKTAFQNKTPFAKVWTSLEGKESDVYDADAEAIQ